VLISFMESEIRDEHSICAAARSFSLASPRAAELVVDLALDKGEIQRKWEDNTNMAANQGTWMHYLCEAWLNRAIICEDSAEVKLFLAFTRTLSGLTAYRTEWTIFGEDENLAGSIDFVAIDEDGWLHLFDWKRSKALRSKYACRFRQMLEPLHYLDDCSGIHYRLQLNCLTLSFLLHSVLLVSVSVFGQVLDYIRFRPRGMGFVGMLHLKYMSVSVLTRSYSLRVISRMVFLGSDSPLKRRWLHVRR